MGKTCSICDGPTVVRWQDLFDDRYGYKGAFPFRRCGRCGHGRLDADFSAAELERLYTDFYPRGSFDLSGWRPSPAVAGFRSWLDGERRMAYAWVPRNVRVLDIGCGMCETLAYHRARGCDVHGVEADANVRRIADEQGFQVKVGLFDPGDYPDGFFDWVTLDQVLEHVADPLATLRGVGRVLRPGGFAAVSTPNGAGWGARVFGRRWIHRHAPYHLQAFTRRSLRRAAERAGLRVERASTITSSEWLNYQWAHFATYPGTGRPSAFWSSGVERTAAEQRLLALATAVHRTKLNHLLTRLFDVTGLGDNLLFILGKP